MISKIKILSKKQTTSGTGTPLILIGIYVYKWSLKLFLRQVTGGCAAHLRGLSWYARFSQVSSHDLYLEAPENFENPFCCTQKVRFDQMSHECQNELGIIFNNKTLYFQQTVFWLVNCSKLGCIQNIKIRR